MKIKLFVLMAAVCLVLIAGLAAAQGPGSPEAVIETLAEEGYLADTEGEVVVESSNNQVSYTGNESVIQWDWGLGEENHRDFVMGTTLYWGPGGEADRCGLVFRQEDDDNFYAVSINRDSRLQVQFSQKENSLWQKPTFGTSDLINTDDTGKNELWLVAQDGVFDFFINGQHALQFADDSFTTGKVALALDTDGQTSPVVCVFTDSWLWEAPDASAGLFGGNVPEPTATPSPTATPRPPAAPTLTDYAKPMKDAVAELERLEIIPAGGSEVFQEPYAYFEGSGSWFTSLASYRPHTHIVVAGMLTFFKGDTTELETCMLMSRVIIAGGSSSTFLQVGFTSKGELLALDIVDRESNAVKIVPVSADLSEPHHILYTAFRDKLTVYLDGKPVIVDLDIQERAGTYGVSLIGVGANARCEGRDLWAWEVDNSVSFGDECGIRVANTVNLRGGPGTEFDKTGTLETGQTVIIVGQAIGSDGFTWWQLESGNWVRSDVVAAGGNCAAVPVVEP